MANHTETELHQLRLDVELLKQRETNTTQVLSRLGQQMEELSASVVKLRVTIATAIGVATVLMPILTFVVPKIINHIWP